MVSCIGTACSFNVSCNLYVILYSECVICLGVVAVLVVEYYGVILFGGGLVLPNSCMT